MQSSILPPRKGNRASQTMKKQEQCIADHQKEALELGQQLRLEREQMKRIHMELLESRRQLAQSQRELERCSNEKEEINHISHEKVTVS